ncbi:MAG TPA: tetratricopeptide repeat protein, partial [Geobacteraceae bacterium]
MDQQLALALRHHQSGRLAEAEAIYRRVLAADPEQADALHLLGVVAHQVGRSDIAVELIGKAVRRNAGNYAPFINLGEAYRGLGRLAEAELCYRRALEIKPDAVEAYNNLGIVLRDLGRPEEAAWACRRALAYKPDFAEAYNNLSNALQELGMLDEAAWACRRALAHKPDFAEAYSNLGATLNELGRPEEAEQACRHALACQPDSASAYCNLGIALKGLGRLDEAEAAYRQALALEPHSARVYSNLGNVLNDLGRLDEADRAYRQALAITPDLYECRIKLAALLPVVLSSREEADDVPGLFGRSLEELEHAVGSEGWAGLGAVVGTAQPFNLAYRLGDHRPLLSQYGAIMCRARKAWFDRSAYAASLSPIPVRDRVRMVVVSGHVSQHSVWNVLLHGLLRHLDRSRFEVILYHTALQPDAETSYVHTLVDRLVQGPTDWLRQVCDDKPDVLLYPEISMDPATFKLATLRLAP